MRLGTLTQNSGNDTPTQTMSIQLDMRTGDHSATLQFLHNHIFTQWGVQSPTAKFSYVLLLCSRPSTYQRLTCKEQLLHTDPLMLDVFKEWTVEMLIPGSGSTMCICGERNGEVYTVKHCENSNVVMVDAGCVAKFQPSVKPIVTTAGTVGANRICQACGVYRIPMAAAAYMVRCVQCFKEKKPLNPAYETLVKPVECLDCGVKVAGNTPHGRNQLCEACHAAASTEVACSTCGEAMKVMDHEKTRTQCFKCWKESTKDNVPKPCSICNATMYVKPTETWKSVCVKCFKEAKAAGTAIPRAQGEYQPQPGDIVKDCSKCKSTMYVKPEENWRTLCAVCYKQTKTSSSPLATPSVLPATTSPGVRDIKIPMRPTQL